MPAMTYFLRSAPLALRAVGLIPVVALDAHRNALRQWSYIVPPCARAKRCRPL